MPKIITDEQILEAALEVMVARGYAGATTRGIAEAAGINEVTLFRRFGSKRNLLARAVEQEAAGFVAAGIDYTGDLEADLLRVLRFYDTLFSRRARLIVALLAEVPRQPELKEIFETPLTIIGRLTALIARYQQEGRLVEEPPFRALVAMVGPLMMDRVMGAIEPGLSASPVDPETHLRRFLEGRATR